jgi:riboflavin synthase
MFTGLIESVGVIRAVSPRGNYLVFDIQAEFAGEPISVGESIDCDGACLTVVSVDLRGFSVEASQETIAKTTVGSYRAGTRLNLERALRADSRLGGHIVAGHVDCTGTVDYMRPVGESRELAVTFDAAFDPYVVPKGSVAINGVSLTVNDNRSAWLQINVIPHTISVTTLGDLRGGVKVNIEFDLVGKYIVKQGRAYLNPGVTVEKLIESGW